MTPLSQESAAFCPICHQPLRSMTERCPHCGAEKSLGPATLETAVCGLAGLVLAPALSTLILPISLWTIAFAVGGLGLGCFFAHYCFNSGRWTRSG